MNTRIEVLQPYLSTARLNFVPIDSPSYQGGGSVPVFRETVSIPGPDGDH